METDAKMTQEAIEAAAHYLTEKIEKQHKRCCKEKNYQNGRFSRYFRIPSECQCEKEKLQIYEGKGLLLKSQTANRRSERRSGFAETSSVDRKLLKTTLKIILKTQALALYNF